MMKQAGKQSGPKVGYFIQSRGPGDQVEFEEVYVYGPTRRSDEGIVGHDLRIRPTRLGPGDYIFVARPDDVEWTKPGASKQLKKSHAQIKREIDEVLARKPGSRPCQISQLKPPAAMVAYVKRLKRKNEASKKLTGKFGDIAKTYFHGLSPRNINHGEGHCYNWAYLAQKVHGGQLMTASWGGSPGHAFVKAGGKFYDSEHPGGVSHWKALTEQFGVSPSEVTVKAHASDNHFLQTWKLDKKILHRQLSNPSHKIAWK